MIARILLGMDFSASAFSALRYGGLLARFFKAELHVLHVVEPDGLARVHPDLFNQVSSDPLLASIKPGSGDRKVEVSYTSGEGESARLTVYQVERKAESPASGILSFAGEINPDLVLLGTHGRRGLDRFFLGSVAERVVYDSPYPVITLRAGTGAAQRFPIRRVLVPIDFSEASTRQVAYAAKMASFLKDATLDLFHVIEDVKLPAAYGVAPITLAVPEVFARTKAALKDLVHANGESDVPFEPHVTSGKPHEKVLDFAAHQETDLILLAPHTPPGYRQCLLGRVSERILRLSPCPVLSLPTHS